MKFLVFTGALLSFIVIGYADKAGWTCESDGYWYENGVKSQYTCDDGGKSKSGKSKSGKSAKQSCTRSDDPAMPSTYPKTCVKGPPDNGLRCWWTLVPDAVKASSVKVPLIIDMHGGDASIAPSLSSGYADLAKSSAQESLFVWPQGYKMGT